MTDQELLFFNREGFIPGPSESEEDFSERVLLAKKKFENGNWIPRSDWDWVRLFLGGLFDFEPEYLPAFYSNQSLRAWQGAATWIEGKKIVSIQLRKALKRGSYLFLYTREEILAHEAVHAARSAFCEPENEEFFAYMTSEKKWHRVLGPIVQSPWELWPFFLAMLAGAIFPIFYLIAAIWVSMGFFRLIRRHFRIKRAFRKILKVVDDEKIARAILFRLTDREIALFSADEKIEEYRKKQRCLRWRLISLAYFKN